MIRLLFVADGPRDESVIPRLVEGALAAPVKAEFRAWKSLRLNSRVSTKGYARKLAFATRIARDAGLRGLVATVDTDSARRGHRLRELNDSLTADRLRTPPLPTALGEATPHAEAWLLDDSAAVRRVLQLDQTTSIPTVRQTASPKQVLHDLIAGSDLGGDDLLRLLAEMARSVDPQRCVHADETGFKAFFDEIKRELSPLIARNS